jgi:hypothetical protein
VGRFLAGFGVGLGLIGIVLAIVLWLIGAFQPPQLPEAKITAIRFEDSEITDFQPCFEAPGVVTVVGESMDVPGDWSVWVCVFPLAVQRYYPQYAPVSNDGLWQRPDVHLGRENVEEDVGKIYFIILVVANDDVAKQLDSYAQSISSGMEELPCGAVICDQIAVLRVE